MRFLSSSSPCHEIPASLSSCHTRIIDPTLCPTSLWRTAGLMCLGQSAKGYIMHHHSGAYITVAVRRYVMDFGINVDFAVRRGGTHEESFQEAFELVELADTIGLDTAWLGEAHFTPNRSVLSATIVVASVFLALPLM